MYDFTEEQIASFLATAEVDEREAALISDNLCESIGLALAMRGIKNASLMCNISHPLLQCLITQLSETENPAADDVADRQQFFLGACNILGALIRSNRLKDDPKIANVLRPVLDTLRGWSVDVLPRVGLIVEEMDGTLQSSSENKK